MIRIIKCMGFVSVGLMLSGFSPMMIQSGTDRDDAKAKLFEPAPTSALVYVFRDNSFLGKDLTSQLVINNVATSKNERNRFSVITLPPGEYEFFSVSSHEANAVTSLIHNKSKAPLKLTLEQGKLYYFQEVFKVADGFILKAVSEMEAKPKIKKGKLSALYQL